MNGGTVVVTGASSFIGSRIAARLAGRFNRVFAVTSGNPDGYEPLRRERLDAACTAGAEIVRMNLLDGGTVAKQLKAIRPDFWIQHAGWARDYAGSDYDLEQGHAVNVQSLGPLYEALAAAGCKGVVVTGTSAEYGDTDEACHEQDACWPSTPYGLSKLAETLRARQLAKHYGIPTRAARVFIPFGPLDAPAKLIPGATRALLRGEPVELSPCGQFRDFIHVDDLAEGYMALLADLRRRSAQLFDLFNLCGGAPVMLKELLLDLAARAGADPALLRFGARPMRPGEPLRSYGSNEKAAQVLRWKPRELSRAVAAYVEELRAGEDARR